MLGRSYRSVSVRLDGGLGDHILGMRILPFIRKRYPGHDVVVYSDSGGHSTQLTVCAMSPLVSRVVPVYSTPKTIADLGNLENVRPQDLASMLSADIFIDAHGEDMFLNASTTLDIPLFEILAHRPELVVSHDAKDDAASALANYKDAMFVGMNLARHGGDPLRRYGSRITEMLERLLQREDVFVLSIFTSQYDFAHYPEPDRTARRQCALRETTFIRELCELNDKIISCVDLPISTVAALLMRCRYFIGVDNGIKHLAWALGVPHTFFCPVMPPLRRALRWMPDFNRMLLFKCSERELDSHLAVAEASLASRCTHDQQR
jgi:hypothetical protein